MSEEKKNPPEGKQIEIKVHIPPDLEYTYRDIFNVFVGPGEVILELGNRHRSMPNHISVANRIVLSHQNAQNLMQSLSGALKEAEERMKEKIDLN